MSRVTVKYQITIPREVRTDLGIVPGAEVDITKKGKEYILVVNPVEQLRKKWRGKLKGGQTTNQYMNRIRGEVE